MVPEKGISALTATIAGALAVAFAAGPAAAQVVNETGEAGELLSTAQITTGHVSVINGKLSNLGVSEDPSAYLPDTDLYRITITNPGAFSAYATTNNAVYEGQDAPAADTQLSLFSSAGLLVGFNDDAYGIPGVPGYDFNPRLPLGGFAGLAAGDYYLGVNLFGRHPTFANGPFPYDPDGGVEGPLTGWNGLTVRATTHYTIQLTGVGSPTPAVDIGVPEPATWALMITGFGVTGARIRRRARAAA